MVEARSLQPGSVVRNHPLYYLDTFFDGIDPVGTVRGQILCLGVPRWPHSNVG
jgi:hypothetical protein